MTRNPAKQARGRTMVSALLYVEVAIIGALALWLIGLTVISGTRDPLPLIGVLLFALLCGKFPFKGANDKELYTQICTAEL